MSQTPKKDKETPQIGSGAVAEALNHAEDEESFDFNEAAVFRRLASDIYSSDQAGVREPLMNSMAAVIKAKRRFNIRNPFIEVKAQDGEQVTLEIRDNGIGITEEVFNNILSVIGVSATRDEGDLPGKYGMGFLACYLLVGVSDGAFILSTNPRGTDEGPYSYVFKPGIYRRIDDKDYNHLLDDNEHGTSIQFFCKDDISIGDIRSWVSDQSEYSPVPIMYEEKDRSGDIDYTEDYGVMNIEDLYNDEYPVLSSENEYYEVITSPGIENNQIVLISAPVRMRGSRNLSSKIPWKVCLRLKQEDGVVIEGPNEGLSPVEDKEYNSLTETEQSGKIPESDLTEEDICLPKPTGTRERVDREDDFIEHVNENLKLEYQKEVERTINTFDPEEESFESLERIKQSILYRFFNLCKQGSDENQDDMDSSDVRDNINSECDSDNIEISDNFCEFILTMSREVPVLTERGGVGRSKYNRKYAYEVYEDYEKTYMTTVASNSWKTSLVNQEDADSTIIRLESAGLYDMFEDQLEWVPLKNITRKTAVDIVDLNEEEIESIIPERGSGSSGTSDLTIHYDGGGRDTKKCTLEETVNSYRGEFEKSGFRDSEALIVFSQTGDKNISDYYEVAKDDTCNIVNCRKSQAETLTENSECAFGPDQYISEIEKQSIETSVGKRTIKDLKEMNRDVLLHVTKRDEENEILTENQILLQELASHIGENNNFEIKPVYAVIEESLMDHFASTSKIENNIYNHLTMIYNSNSGSTPKGCKIKRRSPTELYISAVVPEDIQYSVIEDIKNQYDRLNYEFVSAIETFLSAFDEHDGEFMNKKSKSNISLPKLRTKYGEMSIEEALEKTHAGKKLVIHVLNHEDIVEMTQEDVIENVNTALNYVDDPDNFSNNTIYAAITSGEYKTIKKFKDEEMVDVTVIDQTSYHSRINLNKLYAYAKNEDLMKKIASENPKLEQSILEMSFEKMKTAVNALSPVEENDISTTFGDEKEETKEVTFNRIVEKC